ncbi:glucosaminidase domain-containing protein [Flavobacterium sp. SUN046]|uniref:glucosaminidase domain-containing protein n=1 Tax=Flavobacterium sp. SUN046 TaxID=3002440 RepID=UPI002DB60B0A|nr:glucosaminidase domain-containing protein [Flavobacterium sp. SUN046]MEC4049545.1 glucosaminidase domain-containing protein [Flavobacterium sp. SUN046]
MAKKIVLFLSFLLLVACGSSRPVVRTTKKTNATPVVRVVKKPTSKPTSSSPTKTSSASNGSVANADQSTEVLEATTRVKVTTEMVLAYIEKYKAIAKADMVDYKIPASITLGQGILESGAGTGPLSIQANNHFGIKCHKEWNGPSVKYDDDSEQECFRKYNEPSESYRDHSLFLTGRDRYANLFRLEKNDYKAWAQGLKDAGYATDPAYPSKLIGLIERYQLHQYDAEVLGIDFVPTVATNANSHLVSKGDTLYSISKKYNISVEDLKKKNNLIDNAISIGQSLIIK